MEYYVQNKRKLVIAIILFIIGLFTIQPLVTDFNSSTDQDTSTNSQAITNHGPIPVKQQHHSYTAQTWCPTLPCTGDW